MKRRRTMSAWYMLMDPRFGLYKPASRSTVRPGDRTVGGGHSLLQLRERLVTKWLRARTAAALRRLNPHLLADIGVRYEEIPETVERLIPEPRVSVPMAKTRDTGLVTVPVDRLPRAA
jgi:uncharacterized protein YjiS (DUF1127 family)